eukprot:202718-Chlamydomonas_euryale.AAC.4
MSGMQASYQFGLWGVEFVVSLSLHACLIVFPLTTGQALAALDQGRRSDSRGGQRQPLCRCKDSCMCEDQ